MKLDDILRVIRQTIKPLKNKIMLSIGRGIIAAVKDSTSLQQSQITLLADEVKDQVENFAHFGFSSNPPGGSECIMLSVGGNRDHGVIVATENRSYRKKDIAPGDTSIYNKNGKYILLKGDNAEMLLSKLKIENSENELIAVLYEFMDEVSNGLVTTAIGPQTWTAATKTKLDDVKTKLDSFKV